VGNAKTSSIIVGPALPDVPWEQKLKDCSEVVWRSSLNPIIPRDLIPCSNSIFSSAVVPFEDGFAGVFRVDNKKRDTRIHSGKSKDGIHWQIDEEPIQFLCDCECVGDTPNVVFPCAALFDAPTGRIAIYYGGADTVTCLAFTQVDDLVEYVKANSEI
jgi:predicted GH43/DUF377 family glycosyl hydrolase